MKYSIDKIYDLLQPTQIIQFNLNIFTSNTFIKYFSYKSSYDFIRNLNTLFFILNYNNSHQSFFNIVIQKKSLGFRYFVIHDKLYNVNMNFLDVVFFLVPNVLHSYIYVKHFFRKKKNNLFIYVD